MAFNKNACVFFLSLIYLCACSSSPTANAFVASTLEDQVNVQVTVYNQNLGLVKDMREIDLEKGVGELRFGDVASAINPVSVTVTSLNHPLNFTILEQNYEYDLMDHQKLLDKYVGRDVKILQWNEYQDRKEVIDATLIANNGGQVYRIKDEIYLGHPGNIILPEIPENLIEKPTLSWMYNTDIQGMQKLETSYLTSGMGWKADYVIVLDEKDISASVDGWVSIDNNSGATFKDAELKLVAGDVNRVQPEYAVQKMQRGMMVMAADMAAPQFEEQSFFEYHIYDLQRKATLKNNQTKQINFVKTPNTEVEKEYWLGGGNNYFYSAYRGNADKLPVAVKIHIKNEKKNGLGIPLPKGVVRFYKKDHEGQLQFVGEDSLEHTPKDEELKFQLGEAFDVVAERKQIEYISRSNQLHESEWEVTLRNHKDQAVMVHVQESLSGNWKILSSSQPYEKQDAWNILFKVNVPADGEVKVRYRVQIGI